MLVDVEDIVGEVDKLAHLVLNTVENTVNGLSAARHLLEVRSQDFLELLEHLAGLKNVFQNRNHVKRLGENVLSVSKLPPVHGVGVLDLQLGLVVLLLPAAEHNNGLVDFLLSIRVKEDLFNIDFIAHLLADFI